MLYYEWANGNRPRAGLIAPLAFLTLSVFMWFAPPSAQERISSALRASVLAPFLWTQASLHRARLLRADVGELQLRLDSARSQIHSLGTLAEENRRLRELLELRDRSSAAFVSASLLRSGTSGSESMFLLDAGRLDGVPVNGPVTTAAGLVGVVREVGAATALAMDWTHPDFRASAMTEDGEVFGIVESRRGALPNEERLVLNGVPFQTQVEDGAAVVTSGRGPIYPGGILIGRIAGLAEVEAGWRRSYWLDPAVSAGSALHVLVLTVEARRDSTATGEVRRDSTAAGEARGDSTAAGEVRGDSTAAGEVRGDSTAAGEVRGDSTAAGRCAGQRGSGRGARGQRGSGRFGRPRPVDRGTAAHPRRPSVSRGSSVWVVALLLPILHFVIHVGFGPGVRGPDFLAIGILATAFRCPVGVAAGVGFSLGLVEDALSVLSFGANAMALTVVGILGSWSKELFVGGSVSFLVLYLVVGIWLRGALHWLITDHTLGAEAVRFLLLETPLAALYGAGVGTVLITLADRLVGSEAGLRRGAGPRI